MLTRDQYVCLPAPLDEIVDVDRRLEAERRAEVPDFETIKDLWERRKALSLAASRVWGHKLSGGTRPGTAASVRA